MLGKTVAVSKPLQIALAVVLELIAAVKLAELDWQQAANRFMAFLTTIAFGVVGLIIVLKPRLDALWEASSAGKIAKLQQQLTEQKADHEKLVGRLQQQLTDQKEDAEKQVARLQKQLEEQKADSDKMIAAVKADTERIREHEHNIINELQAARSDRDAAFREREQERDAALKERELDRQTRATLQSGLDSANERLADAAQRMAELMRSLHESNERQRMLAEEIEKFRRAGAVQTNRIEAAANRLEALPSTPNADSPTSPSPSPPASPTPGSPPASA